MPPSIIGGTEGLAGTPDIRRGWLEAVSCCKRRKPTLANFCVRGLKFLFDEEIPQRQPISSLNLSPLSQEHEARASWQVRVPPATSLRTASHIIFVVSPPYAPTSAILQCRNGIHRKSVINRTKNIIELLKKLYMKWLL